MKKDIKVEFLREKNLEKLEAMIEEKGKYEVLSYFAPFFDKRTYLKVDDMGNISLKNYNPILILFALSNNKKKLASYVFEYSYPEEKQNLKKIDRASNLIIPELRINLIKTLQSSNLNFSKIFAKELFFRSSKDFFEVLYIFSMMGNPNNLKLFFVYALEKIFKESKYDDNILFIVVAYLTKYRDDISNYIESSDEEIDLNKLKMSEDKEIYKDIFNEVLSKYDLKNKNKFINTLVKYFEKDFILNDEVKKVLMEK
ncbi:hypothetical protein [Fusobacterium sp.]|uniref:hypothetical protein n=1 Tax=Fusobacterium sp. TaxID=68766 RepID=UPI0025BE4EC4|nr:hypothetical protein [Fusobacterium sp.]MCI7223499.1 hypothetical protein [Fusobacterium sp.]